VLQRLQPLFFTVAIAGLVYQTWMVRRRPPSSRTRAMKVILGVSAALNAIMIAAWVVFSVRYR
jgi:hypothetical protein